MREALADAWDVGEQHPSRQHLAGVHCYPHTDCDPFEDAELSAAFIDGWRHEESYLTDYGQFNPSGHLGNPFRYPRPPLVTEDQRTAINAMHDAGLGVRKIAGLLSIRRPLVRQVIRGLL